MEELAMFVAFPAMKWDMLVIDGFDPFLILP